MVLSISLLKIPSEIIWPLAQKRQGLSKDVFREPMTQEHDDKLFFDEESFSLTVTVWSGSCDNFLNINTRYKHAEILRVVRGRPRPACTPVTSQSLTREQSDDVTSRWTRVTYSMLRTCVTFPVPGMDTDQNSCVSLSSFLLILSLFISAYSFLRHFQQNPKLLPLTLSSDRKRQLPAEMAGLTSVWRSSKAIAACKMSFQNGSLLPTLHTMRLVDVLLVTTASVPPTTPRACDGGLADLAWREHVTVSGRGENSYTYFPY